MWGKSGVVSALSVRQNLEEAGVALSLALGIFSADSRFEVSQELSLLLCVGLRGLVGRAFSEIMGSTPSWWATSIMPAAAYGVILMRRMYHELRRGVEPAMLRG